MTAPVTPAFTLIDDRGREVTERTYRGRFMLVYFGFTHCRLVCPRALERLSAVLDALGPAAEQVQALYITVDPERDSPEVMRAYLTAHPRFTGLTGPGIEDAKAAFRVFARRRPDPEDPDGYAVPHTAISYLVDPEGRYVDHFTDALTAEDLASRLAGLLTV
ncbi:SCO family protein [Pseudonocardia sp. GCM10023141]|uniref:SCO family protein n=1 Tax=Pseudonocardia sp. GCM10023141 TaxID=3252653 RepID=UPI003615D756